MTKGLHVLILCSLYVSLSLAKFTCDYEDNTEIIQVPQNFTLAEPETKSSQRKRQENDDPLTFAWPTGWNNIRINWDATRVDISLKKDPYACYPGSTTYKTSSSTVGVCSNLNTITQDVYDQIVNEYMPTAVKVLTTAYAVQPLQSALITYPSCGNVVVDTPSLPNTDLYIYVTSRPAISGVIATAVYCQVDQRTGRPILGYINFNPIVILQNSATYGQRISTAVHEMSHILGFTFNAMDTYWDPVAQAPLGASKVKMSTQFPTAISGVTRQVWKVITPTVVAEARAHYNCPTLNGLELENWVGSGGTNGSHWEERTVLTEYMCGSLQTQPVFSRFTMALFEDSGWYKGNWSNAGALQWGKNEGCDFLLSYCLTGWPSSDGYLCDSNTASSCTADRTAIGSCYLTSYSTPPDPIYQYPAYGTDNYGNQFTDYCPFISAAIQGDCTVSTNAGSQIVNTRGTSYGPTSRCFQNTMLSANPAPTTSAPGCYTSLCIYGVLKIMLPTTSTHFSPVNIWYDCPTNGQLTPTGWGGMVQCPSFNDLCASSGSPIDPNVPQAFSLGSGQFSALAGDWPNITYINPTYAGPDDTIQIYGNGFTSTMVGIIANNYAASCEYGNSTYMTCVIADQGLFSDFQSILSKNVDVILYDPNTERSTVLSGGLDFDSYLGFWSRVAAWMKKNAAATAGIFIAIVVCIVIAVYFIVREYRKVLTQHRNPAGSLSSI